MSSSPCILFSFNTLKSSWEKSKDMHAQTHKHSWLRPRMYSTSALPLPCQRNHVLSHSANTASAQRRRKQNSSCHLFAIPPVQTSKPPQRLVIKSLGFNRLGKEIKPLSLFHPCLYLDKQMTTCSETVQCLNKGAWGGWAYLSDWTLGGWPCSLPASSLGQTETHSDTHAHADTKCYKCSNAQAQTQMPECAFDCDYTHTPTHPHTHTPKHTRRASPCPSVRIMLLLCVPVGSCSRLGTCLDTSLRQDFIGRKRKLGSLWSTVNGSAYQILLSSTSLATI